MLKIVIVKYQLVTLDDTRIVFHPQLSLETTFVVVVPENLVPSSLLCRSKDIEVATGQQPDSHNALEWHRMLPELIHVSILTFPSR